MIKVINELETLERLRKKPIPLLKDNIDYSLITVNSGDNRSNQPLVDLMEIGLAGQNYYHCTWNPPYNHSIPGSIPYLLARQDVADKLVRVNSHLKSMGLELFILDAYRPLEVQNYFFETWMPNFLESLHPGKGRAWALSETAKYWSAGANDESTVTMYPPPHTTGGAIDLTLRPTNGSFLEMGTIFDDLCDRAKPDFFERTSSSNFTDREARLNRRILFHTMTEEGFVSHPLEWWHFSYGDRIWAATTGQQSFYGYFKQDCLKHYIFMKGKK